MTFILLLWGAIVGCMSYQLGSVFSMCTNAIPCYCYPPPQHRIWLCLIKDCEPCCHHFLTTILVVKNAM